MMKTAALLLSLLPAVALAAVRATIQSGCEDIMQDKFFFATQVQVANVLCSEGDDLRQLQDLIIDHLALPKTFTKQEETDICRTHPIPGEPCAGYLAEQPEDQATFAWNWRGTGSCGVFLPNPACDPTKNDASARRLMDLWRLSRKEESDTLTVPDFNNHWLTDEQRAQLQALQRKREELMVHDRRMENTLTNSSQVSDFELHQIMERNRGNEKLILAEILDLFNRYESQDEGIQAKLRAFELDMQNEISELLWKQLHGKCFLDDQPLVQLVLTPMATREYAAAYVEEQC